MSRAYLFDHKTGEQVGRPARWYGDLCTDTRYGAGGFSPTKVYVIAVRGAKGYRLRITPALPGGESISEQIANTRMSHGMFGPIRNEQLWPSLDAVRAFLILGGHHDHERLPDR